MSLIPMPTAVLADADVARALGRAVRVINPWSTFSPGPIPSD
jgi:hypothetical protein